MRPFEDDQQPDEDQYGRPEKMPSEIPESPVVIMKEWDIPQEEMDAESNKDNTEN